MPEQEKVKSSEKLVDIDTSGPEKEVAVEEVKEEAVVETKEETCLLYTSPSPRD